MEKLRTGDDVTARDPRSPYYGKPGKVQFKATDGSYFVAFHDGPTKLNEKEIIRSKDFKPED